MNGSVLARIPRVGSVLLATGVLAIAGIAPAANAATSDSDTYTWSARLVELDAAHRTVTVESLVVAVGGLENAAKLHAGDRAMLAWSGITSASGVRDITPGGRSEHDGLTLPIEFVSTEMDGRYVRFKVRVPGSDVAAIESLEPGEWITATSPQHAQGPDRAVSSIRPYNSVSSS